MVVDQADLGELVEGRRRAFVPVVQQEQSEKGAGTGDLKLGADKRRRLPHVVHRL